MNHDLVFSSTKPIQLQKGPRIVATLIPLSTGATGFIIFALCFIKFSTPSSISSTSQ